MNHAFCNQLVRAAIPFAFTLLASVANAQQGGSAKGILTVEGEDAPLSVKLIHAYYITGPDSMDETNIERLIVLTPDDQAEAISACTNRSCAELSTVDGLMINISDPEMIRWWAHVAPVQYSGFADALTLRLDTPDHLVGTFKTGGSGATANIEFDAPLIKAFDH